MLKAIVVETDNIVDRIVTVDNNSVTKYYQFELGEAYNQILRESLKI